MRYRGIQSRIHWPQKRWLRGWKAILKSNGAKLLFRAFSRVIQALSRKNAFLPLDLFGQSLLNPLQY
jgi:hypothetical protein